MRRSINTRGCWLHSHNKQTTKTKNKNSPFVTPSGETKRLKIQMTKQTNTEQKKNYLRCWDCKMQNKDCYCKINKKRIIKNINKEFLK